MTSHAETGYKDLLPQMHGPPLALCVVMIYFPKFEPPGSLSDQLQSLWISQARCVGLEKRKLSGKCVYMQYVYSISP